SSARCAEDLDRENERVAEPDSSAGLTVGVAIRRDHYYGDCGPDLCPAMASGRPGTTPVSGKSNRRTWVVAAVEHGPVTSVDSHVADRDPGRAGTIGPSPACR